MFEKIKKRFNDMAIQLKNHMYNANTIDAFVDNKVSTINDTV